jgi:hypothetical protein
MPAAFRMVNSSTADPSGSVPNAARVTRAGVEAAAVAPDPAGWGSDPVLLQPLCDTIIDSEKAATNARAKDMAARSISDFFPWR